MANSFDNLKREREAQEAAERAERDKRAQLAAAAETAKTARVRKQTEVCDQYNDMVVEVLEELRAAVYPRDIVYRPLPYTACQWQIIDTGVNYDGYDQDYSRPAPEVAVHLVRDAADNPHHFDCTYGNLIPVNAALSREALVEALLELERRKRLPREDRQTFVRKPTEIKQVPDNNRKGCFSSLFG